MEDYEKDAGGRRDYGQDGERKYSSEGRVLRPRKKVGTSAPHKNYEGHRSYGAPGYYGERRYQDRPGPSDGERRSYGEGRSYGESRGYGEGRSHGEGRPHGENRSYGENRGYGERRSNFSGNGGRGGYNGPRKDYGERRSYGDGERRFQGKPGPSDGERRSYGENRGYGESRGYGEGRSYGENRGYGERRNNFSGDGGRGSYKKAAPHGKPAPKGRKPYRKEEAFKDDSGISRMLESRPQIEKLQYSDFDSAPVPVKDEIRLNKFIANSGVCSRREADTFIQAGVVTVNGQVVTELGTKVNASTDDIRFNGERLKGEEKVYVVMNKPKGYVTTASDPHAEKTVMDLLKGCQGRVFPVGRLDKATTGVLMFTNDGEIAERLTHPSYDKKKIYQVLLDHPLTQEDYDKIRSGIMLSDGEIHADELEYIDESDRRKLGIEIHSGKNRIVRRIFESLGYDVRALDRVYFAGLTKKGLQKGEWRYLSQGEINILKMGAYV